jgi:WD40 repeat protein
MDALCRPGSTGQVAIPSRDGHAVEIWDAVKRARLHLLVDSEDVSSPAWFSRDGNHLVTVGRQTDSLWNVSTERRIVSLPAAGGVVSEAAGDFPVTLSTSTSPSTLTALTADGDTSSLALPTAGNPDVAAVSRDGSTMLLHRGDLESQSLLPRDPEQWARRLCGVIDRPLSGAELATLPTASRPHAGCPS